MGRKKKESTEETTVSMEAGGDVVTAEVATSSTEKVSTKKKQTEQNNEEKKPIEIKSAFLKNSMFCSYDYDENKPSNVVRSQSVKDYNVPVHPDLLQAFKKLNVHLAIICEEIKPEEIHDVDNIADYDDKVHALGSIEHRLSLFRVRSWQLQGEYEKEGVVLIGSKRLTTNDLVKLETPKRKWSDNYRFINELRVAIMDCIYEVEEYHNGKRAPERQTALEFPEEESYVEEDL